MRDSCISAEALAKHIERSTVIVLHVKAFSKMALGETLLYCFALPFTARCSRLVHMQANAESTHISPRHARPWIMLLRDRSLLFFTYNLPCMHYSEEGLSRRLQTCVIASPLLWIAQDAVGCGYLLELLGCALNCLPLVLVRVIRQCQLPICTCHKEAFLRICKEQLSALA